MAGQTILFLETSLDKSPASTRSQIGFLREFLGNYKDKGVEVVARQVHSRKDLEFFLALARRKPSYHVIHISGHGSGGDREAKLYLTNSDEIDLSKKADRDLFKGLKGKVIFFSCCRVGRSEKIMGKVLESSGASAIFSYMKNVNDRECFLIESMFYELWLTKGRKPVFDSVYKPLSEAIAKVFRSRGSKDWLVVDHW